VEFVPVSRSILTTGLDASTCDLVMSGVAIGPDRALHVQFSAPYLDETMAFLVPDHLSADFSEWSDIKAMGRLRLGVPNAPYFIRKIHDELPDAEIAPLGTMDEMFRPQTPPLDVFVATAERGSAYTLLHPEYSVVVPKPRPMKVPLGYVIAGHDSRTVDLVNTWIDLKRKDGTIDELFAHWILGQQAEATRPRWSVVRNVLHLVK
jgi:ABC-type amino acid transport substrate-binding protein